MEEHRIVELLSSITRKLARSLIPIIEAEGLALTESLVLWKIKRRQPCRVTEIAEQVGMSPSTLTGVLDRLVVKNLIERIPDPDDRRAILMRITPLTSALLSRLTVEVDAKVGAVFRFLPPETAERIPGDLQSFLDCLQLNEDGGS